MDHEPQTGEPRERQIEAWKSNSLTPRHELSRCCAGLAQNNENQINRVWIWIPNYGVAAIWYDIPNDGCKSNATVREVSGIECQKARVPRRSRKDLALKLQSRRDVAAVGRLN